jgi:hypothetical protein
MNGLAFMLTTSRLMLFRLVDHGLDGARMLALVRPRAAEVYATPTSTCR